MRSVRALLALLSVAALSACGQSTDETTSVESPRSSASGSTADSEESAHTTMPESDVALIPVRTLNPGRGAVLMEAIDYGAGSNRECDAKAVTVSVVAPDSGTVTTAYSILVKGRVTEDLPGLDRAAPDDVRLCGHPESGPQGSITGPALPLSPDLDRHAATKGNAVGWVDTSAEFHEVARGTEPLGDFNAASETRVDRPWFDHAGNFYYLERPRTGTISIVRVTPDGETSAVDSDSGVHVDRDAVPVDPDSGKCLGGAVAWLDDESIVTSSLERRPAATISHSVCTDYVGLARRENAPLIQGAASEPVRGAALSESDDTLYFGYGGTEKGPEKLYRTSTTSVEEPVLVPTRDQLIGLVVAWRD